MKVYWNKLGGDILRLAKYGWGPALGGYLAIKYPGDPRMAVVPRVMIAAFYGLMFEFGVYAVIARYTDLIGLEKPEEDPEDSEAKLDD